MFESAGTGGGSGAGALSDAELDAVRVAVRQVDPGLDDAVRLERIHRLEELRAAVAAAQAVEVAAFVSSRRAVVAAEITANSVPGVGTRRRVQEAERGIVADVAIARRQSPAQASRFIGFALSAPSELPATFALFAAGKLSERRMSAVHQATGWLPGEHRRTVDAQLAPRVAGWGDRRVEQEATAAAYRVDPAGACERAARAAGERHVSLRPAPESMTWLSALLPLTQGVAAWAALDRAARSAAAAGDDRGRGQVMADTLIERVTGQTTAEAVPIAVQLVMTDRSLTGGQPAASGVGGTEADEPARLVGHGPIPAPLARDLVLAETDAARSVRRLLTDPAGRLVAMESQERCFTPAMAHYIRVRDDMCRTPWCDAPIRQIDHVRPDAAGGPTSVANARGLCARCNLTAQASGSHAVARTDPNGEHLVVSLTPMGQVHRSRPPDLPGRRPPEPPDGRPLHGPPFIDLVWVGRHHAA